MKSCDFEDYYISIRWHPFAEAEAEEVLLEEDEVRREEVGSLRGVGLGLEPGIEDLTAKE
jgi:hypothetical protein